MGLILVVFLLILSTVIIKNSAKKTEDEIFIVKENVRVLFSEFEIIKLIKFLIHMNFTINLLLPFE